MYLPCVEPRTVQNRKEKRSTSCRFSCQSIIDLNVKELPWCQVCLAIVSPVFRAVLACDEYTGGPPNKKSWVVLKYWYCGMSFAPHRKPLSRFEQWAKVANGGTLTRYCWSGQIHATVIQTKSVELHGHGFGNGNRHAHFLAWVGLIFRCNKSTYSSLSVRFSYPPPSSLPAGLSLCVHTNRTLPIGLECSWMPWDGLGCTAGKDWPLVYYDQ